jgi:nucleoid-associated protein YgaU
VTASRKLFVASVLLVAGFGVACLLGEPAARIYAPSSGVAVSQSAPADRQPQTSLAHSGRLGAARLVPDFATDNPYRVKTDSSGTSAAPPLTNDTDNSVSLPFEPSTAIGNADASPYSSYTPRAKLRSEAPRPLDFDRRPTAGGEVAPPPPSPRTDAEVAQVSAETTGPVATLRNAYVEPVQTGVQPAAEPNPVANPPATITASFTQPVAPMLNQVLITAPPWPAPDSSDDESNGSRKHVVVDGDSLEKLAGRYLDDPQRAGEIYEANRELLTSPDLLPIGAELVIPDRRDQTARDTLNRQSLASELAVRSASHNMVPVRPIPPAGSVMPRAQLLPPRPVE